METVVNDAALNGANDVLFQTFQVNIIKVLRLMETSSVDRFDNCPYFGTIDKPFLWSGIESFSACSQEHSYTSVSKVLMVTETAAVGDGTWSNGL